MENTNIRLSPSNKIRLSSSVRVLICFYKLFNDISKYIRYLDIFRFLHIRGEPTQI